MHIVITGANGFIGSTLVRRLLSAASPLELTRLTALDLVLDQLPDDARLHGISGSFADPEVLARALAVPADIVFHLAAVPSGLCESRPDIGMEVNVQGMIRLLDALRAQGNCPRLVFSSSIAIYGKPRGELVDDDTGHFPTLTYGAQKVIGEVLVSDYSRRGWIDGISLRVPGIVARPPEPNGAVSIFFSDLIRELSAGRPFTCPVSATARSWLLSVGTCVDNLLHAARLDLPERRTWSIPATTVVIGELVQAIADFSRNPEVNSLISYTPDDWVEFNFGSYPPLELPGAEALGLRADASLEDLVRDALQD